MSSTNPSWPFLDPPNTAVFTDAGILDGVTWIRYVTHDEDDGAWQFHATDDRISMREAAVTSLRQILSLDESVAVLADLALGWCAWREDQDAEWIRQPIE